MKRLNYLQQQWLLGIILLFTVVIAVAAPKQIKLHYEVSRNGELFANVKETFKQDGQHYEIKSVTKGIGIYALMGERKLLSKGVVTANGLKPEYFESKQSKRQSKTLINDFDWKNKVLKMQVKGKYKEAQLETGAQDILSVMYQFMFQKPTQNKLSLPVTTGKRYGVKTYQVTMADTLNTKAGKFKVVSLKHEGRKTRAIFLAKDKQYLPVKLVVVKDGETLEQTITKISLE